MKTLLITLLTLIFSHLLALFDVLRDRSDTVDVRDFSEEDRKGMGL